MSSLALKRLFVWVVSMAAGAIISSIIVTVGFPLIKAEAAGISVGEYGRLYFLFTALPLGFVVLIWLDYFLDTKILSN